MVGSGVKDSAGGWLPGDQAVLLDEARDARRIGLQAVALRHLAEHLGRGASGQEELDELLEIALEAGRRDDLEDPGTVSPAFQKVCH